MAEMQAGRELDAIIAEKVMGLEVIENEEGYWYCRRCGWVHGAQVSYSEVHQRCGTPVVGDWPCDSAGNVHPRFSTDIAAAWRVMEKVLGGDDAYEFVIALLEMCGAIENVGETHINLVLRILSYLTPEHVCLAAHKAVGGEPNA